MTLFLALPWLHLAIEHVHVQLFKRCGLLSRKTIASAYESLFIETWVNITGIQHKIPFRHMFCVLLISTFAEIKGQCGFISNLAKDTFIGFSKWLALPIRLVCGHYGPFSRWHYILWIWFFVTCRNKKVKKIKILF